MRFHKRITQRDIASEPIGRGDAIFIQTEDNTYIYRVVYVTGELPDSRTVFVEVVQDLDADTSRKVEREFTLKPGIPFMAMIVPNVEFDPNRWRDEPEEEIGITNLQIVSEMCLYLMRFAHNDFKTYFIDMVEHLMSSGYLPKVEYAGMTRQKRNKTKPYKIVKNLIAINPDTFYSRGGTLQYLPRATHRLDGKKAVGEVREVDAESIVDAFRVFLFAMLESGVFGQVSIKGK